MITVFPRGFPAVKDLKVLALAPSTVVHDLASEFLSQTLWEAGGVHHLPAHRPAYAAPALLRLGDLGETDFAICDSCADVPLAALIEDGHERMTLSSVIRRAHLPHVLAREDDASTVLAEAGLHLEWSGNSTYKARQSWTSTSSAWFDDLVNQVEAVVASKVQEAARHAPGPTFLAVWRDDVTAQHLYRGEVNTVLARALGAEPLGDGLNSAVVHHSVAGAVRSLLAHDRKLEGSWRVLPTDSPEVIETALALALDSIASGSRKDDVLVVSRALA